MALTNVEDQSLSPEIKEIKVIAVSGGFDPLHLGHVNYLREAKKLGNTCNGLIVFLNSDDWLIQKKGYRLIPF